MTAFRFRGEVGLDLKRCVEDFGYFAEHVLGLRLWPGQRKAAASKKIANAKLIRTGLASGPGHGAM